MFLSLPIRLLIVIHYECLKLNYPLCLVSHCAMSSNHRLYSLTGIGNTFILSTAVEILSLVLMLEVEDTEVEVAIAQAVSCSTCMRTSEMHNIISVFVLVSNPCIIYGQTNISRLNGVFLVLYAQQIHNLTDYVVCNNYCVRQEYLCVTVE